MSVFGVILVRIFPTFSRIRTECGKFGENADQNNSKYGHIYVVEGIVKAHHNRCFLETITEHVDQCFWKISKKKIETNEKKIKSIMAVASDYRAQAITQNCL